MGQPHVLTLTGTGSTPWLNLNTDITPHNTQIVVVADGAVTGGVEWTMDDLNRRPNAFPQPAPNPPITPTIIPDPIIGPGTAFSATAKVTQAEFPYWGVRFTSTVSAATVTMTVIQSGIAGP
jgi:hypothetical protein